MDRQCNPSSPDSRRPFACVSLVVPPWLIPTLKPAPVVAAFQVRSVLTSHAIDSKAKRQGVRVSSAQEYDRYAVRQQIVYRWVAERVPSYREEKEARAMDRAAGRARALDG